MRSAKETPGVRSGSGPHGHKGLSVLPFRPDPIPAAMVLTDDIVRDDRHNHRADRQPGRWPAGSGVIPIKLRHPGKRMLSATKYPYQRCARSR